MVTLVITGVIIIIVVLLFWKCSSSISGIFNEIKLDNFKSNVLDTLRNDTGKPMSSNTYSLNQKVLEAQAGLAEAEEKLDSSTWFLTEWWNGMQLEKAQAKAARAVDNYELGKATDPIYQEAIGGEVAFDPKILIIVAVVIGVILLLLLLLRRSSFTTPNFSLPQFRLPKFGKQRAPVIVADATPQPAVVQQPVAAISALSGAAPLGTDSAVIAAPVAQTQIQQAAMQSLVPIQGPEGRISTLEVDYDSLLARQCTYLGISITDVLAECDGNVQKAWHKTYLMLPPEAQAEMRAARDAQLHQ